MKTNTHSILGRAALIASAFALCSGLTYASPDTVKHSDKAFLEKAGKCGMEEVSISQVAAERSTNPRVKDFAQMMVNDHTAANAALASLASAKGVSLAAKDPAPAKWSKKAGKDFDEDYMAKMVEDHEDAVKLFSKEADDGKDADVTAFARKTLPTLQHHLEQAKDLKKMVK